MCRLVLLALTVLLAFSQINARSTKGLDGGESITNKDLPCLGKLVGQRLPHPKDKHKFLRCVSADTMWIETCPDNLFYNPTMELCDWTVVSRTTTHSNIVVKNRPVFFKIGSGSLTEEAPMNLDDSEVSSSVSGGRGGVQSNRRSPFNSRVETDDQQLDMGSNFGDDTMSQKPKSRSFKPLADQ